MEEIVCTKPAETTTTAAFSTVISPNPRKRSFAEVESKSEVTPTKLSNQEGQQRMSPGVIPTPPLTFGSSNGSPASASGEAIRGVSPALTKIDPESMKNQGSQPNPSTSTDTSPAKRRKLTVAERERRKQEKEAKEKERTEQKAKREEEKRLKEEEKRAKEEENKLKDEERRKRNEAKEAKKRERDLEKQAKEEEKRKLDEEKTKKQRAQMRINAFFAKPTNSDIAARRRSISVESGGNVPGLASTSNSPHKPNESDFQRDFLPFALQSHMRLAPYRPSHLLGRAADTSAVDRVFTEQAEPSAERIDAETQPRLAEIFLQCHGRRGRRQPRVKDIIARIHGSVTNPIDLTDIMDSTAALLQPTDYLQAVTMKYLHFAEDVRPPYCGTFTKAQSPADALRLSRNPFRRQLPLINYDYDSEAEWEEPGEGEDLDSEGEEDPESVDGDNDMEGFLDDEDAGGLIARKRQNTEELEPRCSGLVWEDVQGRAFKSGHASYDMNEMKAYRLEVILDIHKIPIDPFSTLYWQSTERTANSTISETTVGGRAAADSGLMQPPRLPLQARPNSTAKMPPLDLVDADGKPVKPTASTSAPVNPSKPIRLLEGVDLAEFKRAVDGSNLKRAQLLELLKSRFPRTSQKVIRDTLGSVAARVGLKEEDKKWAVITQ